MLLQLLGGIKLLEAQRINKRDSIQRQIARITQLATNSQILQDWVGGDFIVKGDGGGFDVFDEFAEA